MKRRDFIKLNLIAAPAISMSYRARAEDAELIIGSNVGAPPFAFKKDDGYSGFDIEVWAEMAKGLNRKWRVQPMEFGTLIPALQTRNIDAIVSQLFIKPERQKVIEPRRVCRRLQTLRRWSNGKTANRFSPEVRARAVRLVFEHEKDHASRWASVTRLQRRLAARRNLSMRGSRRRRSTAALGRAFPPR